MDLFYDGDEVDDAESADNISDMNFSDGTDLDRLQNDREFADLLNNNDYNTEEKVKVERVPEQSKKADSNEFRVGVGTVIVGDVSGSSAYIAGAIKGNIDVDGPVIIDSTAIVKGNIKAKSIQINTGALVDGYCSLEYAGIDLEQFFK